MKTKTSTVLASALAAAFLLPAGAQAGSPSPGCGTTLGPGGSFVLDQDIVGCAGVALNLVGPVTVSGGGHRVGCNGGAGHVGIQATGKGVKLSGVEVSFCETGIDLAGDGGHIVSKVYVHDFGVNAVRIDTSSNKLSSNLLVPGESFTGVIVAIGSAGEGNTVRGNLVVGSDDDGINVLGSGNKVQRNFVVGAQGAAIDIDDATAVGNTVLDNVVADSSFGIDTRGTGGSLAKNLLARNEAYGLLVQSDSSATKITGNVAIGTFGTDLYTETAGCGTNSWKTNVFSTSNDPCIE